ncbi:unnamed protein product [Orchesella dallaii]|uniref:Uncharacterized protein n=1 Tax=Orchesella dallaii TaxID=48710 RepID=A0ABP1REF3_9HEXA
MAQDSMAFLFLVAPDIGNVRSNVVPIDNKASNNIPSTSAASTSVVIKNINKSDRNSMSPTQLNIMPSYANLNENSDHVYNNFSMANANIVEQPAPISQSPRVVRKSLDSPATVVSESNVNSSSSSVSNQKNNAASVASSKNASSVQTTSSRVAAATTKQIEEKRDNRDKESTPPPLPCRSSIPHVQAKSEKGSSTPIKAHSNTPERTNSNPSSLKSNQKNLAEFKNLAELTFSKTGAPTPSPNRSIKEPSPVSSKIINVSEVEKKVDPKDAKPPRKPGKTQPVPSSSKENRSPKDNIKSDVLATVELKPDEVVTAAAEEIATKPLESSDISGNSRSPIQFMHEEFLAPKPMPRGLKKQQSVERELQSPERPLSAPKPAPRTAANKQVTSGAPCDSKDLPSQESVLVNLVAPTLATSSNASVTPETTQQVVEGGCQTTLPFPLAKHRGMTTSPPNIKPASFNAATAGTSAVKPDLVINEKGTSLLRPSAFVAQQAKSSENDGKLTSSSSRSSSVLLYITPNSSSPTVAPTQSTIVNNVAVTSSSSSTITPNIAHVQPFSTKQVSTSTPTAHVAPYPSSSNSTQVLNVQRHRLKGKVKSSVKDNVNSYLKMVELMEKQDLILTSEDSECPICFDPLLAGDGVVFIYF